MTHSSNSEKRIRLAVRSVDALLDGEGSPVVEPRIHPDAAEAIWTEAVRAKNAGAFEICLTVPAADEARIPEAAAAIHHHFQRRGEDLGEELREIFREGRRSLAIGLLVVAGLIAASEGLLYLNASRLMYVLSESLIIIAWVALWHPAELLLYAHFPVRQQKKTAQALARAAVRLA